MPRWHGEPNGSVCPLGGWNWRWFPIKMSRNLQGECGHHSRCLWPAFTLWRGLTMIPHPWPPIVLTGMPTSHGQTWSLVMCITDYTNCKRPWLMPEHCSIGQNWSTLQHLANATSWHYAWLNWGQYVTLYHFHRCWGIWWGKTSMLGAGDSIQGSSTRGTWGHMGEEPQLK